MSALKPFRTGLSLLVAATLLGGCSASVAPMSSADRDDSAQLAAYAATAKYPADAQVKTDTKLAAMIQSDTIKIINFSDQPVRDANVWINGTFVHKVDSIPPLGAVSARKSEFFDGTGRALGNSTVTVQRVTVQQGDTVWATLGPVMER